MIASIVDRALEPQGARLVRYVLLLLTELEEQRLIQATWGAQRLTSRGRAAAEQDRREGYAPAMAEILECLHWLLRNDYVRQDALTELGAALVAARQPEPGHA